MLWNLLCWTSFIAMACARELRPPSDSSERKLTGLPVRTPSPLCSGHEQGAVSSETPTEFVPVMTEVRVGKVSEAIAGLRITKALELEAKVKADLYEARTVELVQILLFRFQRSQNPANSSTSLPQRQPSLSACRGGRSHRHVSSPKFGHPRHPRLLHRS